ncbi:MAG: carboxylesterase family protein, partial [Candidatus Binatia bacterium]
MSERRSARPLGALLCLVLAGAACRPEKPPAPPVADADSRRTLVTGDVVGFTGRYGAHVWMGIPYAAPPEGERRWRAPAPPQRWSGVREALRPGGVCPQFPSRFAGIESDDPDEPVGEEDCLYLNVYAPRFAPDEVPGEGRRLPVLFWIHGGGNVIGHASFYDGGNLASTERVVVVALNYRLGPLGWFRHAALREGARSDADRSGNYGTLDLVRGLEWVRENAAAFGGDPRNVTLFGESAGARNVFSLLLAPAARGLFHRAIVQSGGTGTTPLAEAEAFADGDPPGERNSSNEVLLRLLGGGGERREAKRRLEAMKPAEVEAALRRFHAYELLATYATEAQEGLIDVPQLFRDGVVLPAADPLAVLRSGEYNRVPTIFGTNRDEDKLFLAVNREYVRWPFGLLPLVRDAGRYEATARHLSLHW